jgi:hypothetical protein
VLLFGCAEWLWCEQLYLCICPAVLAHRRPHEHSHAEAPYVLHLPNLTPAPQLLSVTPTRHLRGQHSIWWCHVVVSYVALMGVLALHGYCGATWLVYASLRSLVLLLVAFSGTERVTSVAFPMLALQSSCCRFVSRHQPPSCGPKILTQNCSRVTTIARSQKTPCFTSDRMDLSLRTSYF